MMLWRHRSNKMQQWKCTCKCVWNIIQAREVDIKMGLCIAVVVKVLII